MSRAAVFGTGSWGTAYAAVLADAGTPVTMWGRRASVANAYSYPDPNLSTQIPNQYGATSPSGMSLVSSTSGAQAKAGLVQTIQGRGPDVASGAVSGELIPLSASTATQGTMGNSQYAAGAAPRTPVTR